MYKELGLHSSPCSSEGISAKSRGSSSSQDSVHVGCSQSPLPDGFRASPACQELISDKQLMQILEDMGPSPVSGECSLSPIFCRFLSTEKPADRSKEAMPFRVTSKIRKQNSEDGSLDKISGDSKASSFRDVQSVCRKDGIRTGKRHASFNADFDDSKATKDVTDASVDLSKNNAFCRAVAKDQGESFSSQRKDQLRFGGRQQLKGFKLGTTTSPKYHTKSIRFDSPASMKDHNTTGDYPSKGKFSRDGVCTELGKTKKFGGNSFGDLELARERTDLSRSLLGHEPKEPKFNFGQKKGQTLAKKAVNKFCAETCPNSGNSQTHPKAPAGTPSGNGPVSDVIPATTNHAQVEDWICCDSCGKWRLLPFGTNAEHLQKDEWQCSMLNWLPGMNHCRFSEEETTKALKASYQVPTPDSHHDIAGQFSMDNSLAAFCNVGKENKLCSDDVKPLKSKFKRLANQEGLHMFKKTTTESMHGATEENVRVMEKLGSRLSNSFPTVSDRQKHRANSSFKDSMPDQKVSLPVSAKERRDGVKVSANGTGMGMENSGDGVTFSRKGKSVDCQNNVGSFQREETKKNAEVARKLRLGLSNESKSGQKERLPPLVKKPIEKTNISFTEGGMDKGSCEAMKGELGNGIPNKIGEEKCRAYSSSIHLKSHQKEGMSALAKKPRNIIRISLKGRSTMRNSDNAKIVAEDGKMEVHSTNLPSNQDNTEATNRVPIEKQQKAYSSSNDTAPNQKAMIPSPAKKPKDQVVVSFDSRGVDMEYPDNVKADFEKRKLNARPSNVHSFQDNKEEYIVSAGNNRAYFSSNDSKSDQRDKVSSSAKKASGGVGNGATQPTTTDLSGDQPKVPKQTRNPVKQNGSRLQDGSTVRDPRHQRAVEKVSGSKSAGYELIEEGNELEKKVVRLKDFVPELESTGLLFQAALKFFRGAFLLESSGHDISKPREITDAISMYMKTAKLCQFVAHEYERLNGMAAAALAYKCIEVAYMRITYSKDWKALQNGLLKGPLGESPSSPVSDVDNSNNQRLIDRVAEVHGDGSHIAQDHTIPAVNLPNYERLLHNTEVVCKAMDATWKCQEAHAAATSVRREESKYAEGLSFVQRVINSNFHDVEGLIRLVQLAVEAITD